MIQTRLSNMPSSEECHEAADNVRNWFYKKLKADHSDWPESAVVSVFAATDYSIMLERYCKETGAYRGPYSPLG